MIVSFVLPNYSYGPCVFSVTNPWQRYRSCMYKFNLYIRKYIKVCSCSNMYRTSFCPLKSSIMSTF